MQFRNIASALLIGVLFVVAPFTASSQEVDCLKCHSKLKKEKTVHAALEMGCTTCHTGINAKVVPHTKSGAIDKGLSAEQPDLCYGCHDKNLFTKKNVHAAVGMGCTGCHNPHSSKNEKLIKAEIPDLCFGCHDKAAFTRKNTHPPVAGGMCLSCHNPHSSDQMALLIKKPYDLCLDCHNEVPKKSHATSQKHPLGGDQKKVKKGKAVELMDMQDPARPGKVFYCGSCHDPHSTDVNRLLRFGAKSAMDLCSNCHKM